jgi:hypothetical protein
MGPLTEPKRPAVCELSSTPQVDAPEPTRQASNHEFSVGYAARDLRVTRITSKCEEAPGIRLSQRIQMFTYCNLTEYLITEHAPTSFSAMIACDAHSCDESAVTLNCLSASFFSCMVAKSHPSSHVNTAPLAAGHASASQSHGYNDAPCAPFRSVSSLESSQLSNQADSNVTELQRRNHHYKKCSKETASHESNQKLVANQKCASLQRNVSYIYLHIGAVSFEIAESVPKVVLECKSDAVDTTSLQYSATAGSLLPTFLPQRGRYSLNPNFSTERRNFTVGNVKTQSGSATPKFASPYIFSICIFLSYVSAVMGILHRVDQPRVNGCNSPSCFMEVLRVTNCRYESKQEPIMEHIIPLAWSASFLLFGAMLCRSFYVNWIDAFRIASRHYQCRLRRVSLILDRHVSFLSIFFWSSVLPAAHEADHRSPFIPRLPCASLATDDEGSKAPDGAGVSCYTKLFVSSLEMIFRYFFGRATAALRAFASISVVCMWHAVEELCRQHYIACFDRKRFRIGTEVARAVFVLCVATVPLCAQGQVFNILLTCDSSMRYYFIFVVLRLQISLDLRLREIDCCTSWR